MNLDWLPKALVPAAVIFAFALFKRLAPAKNLQSEHSYSESQTPDPLPTGVIGGAMWGLAFLFALSFFLLRGANHWWATLDGPTILTQYAPQPIWCFFPGFAALAVPWPLTLWYLRRRGRWEEANRIADASSSKAGFDSFRIMMWMSYGLVVPIGVFTLLAIPIHLSISNTEVRIGHYASLHPEQFPFSQARRLTIVKGYLLRDGTFQSSKDAIVDFADGRHLHGNVVGDGGTDIREDVLQLLIQKTGLTPQYALTEKDIPPLPSSQP